MKKSGLSKFISFVFVMFVFGVTLSLFFMVISEVRYDGKHDVMMTESQTNEETTKKVDGVISWDDLFPSETSDETTIGSDETILLPEVPLDTGEITDTTDTTENTDPSSDPTITRVITGLRDDEGYKIISDTENAIAIGAASYTVVDDYTYFYIRYNNVTSDNYYLVINKYYEALPNLSLDSYLSYDLVEWIDTSSVVSSNYETYFECPLDGITSENCVYVCFKRISNCEDPESVLSELLTYYNNEAFEVYISNEAARG